MERCVEGLGGTLSGMNCVNGIIDANRDTERGAVSVSATSWLAFHVKTVVGREAKWVADVNSGAV